MAIFLLTKICGGATGTRTLDPMIKSHLLYQLSYSPRTFFQQFGPDYDTFFAKSKKIMVCTKKLFSGRAFLRHGIGPRQFRIGK